MFILLLMLVVTGKTHTILGTPEMPGIIPRCVTDLFNAVKQQQLDDATSSFVVSYSYLEIYNEKVLVYSWTFVSGYCLAG